MTLSPTDAAAVQQAINLLQELLATPSSPTPTIPILTPARLASLKSTQQANDPAWQAIQKIAQSSLTTPDPNEPGLAATIVWKLTNDPAYLAAAWSRLLAYTAMPTSAPYDSGSDALPSAPIMACILWGTGTGDQQSQLVANLTALGNLALGRIPGIEGGFEPSNANYTIPYWFLLVILDFLKIACPAGGLWLSQTSTGGGLDLPVGGLDSTGTGRKTARNCIADYLRLSAGGTWCEGGDYDTKSVPRLILGWVALQDLLGTDHLPEVAAWIPQACDAARFDYAPDFIGCYQWGDRTRLGPDYARRLSIYAALQAAANRLGDAQRTANMGYLIQNVLAKYLATSQAADPMIQLEGHFWWFYDPALPAGGV